MEMNFGVETTKVQPLYILYVLKRFTDEKNTLTQEGIARKLRDLGYCPVRKDKNGKTKERKLDETKSIGQDLKLLYCMGYPIHGVERELDEDGNELPATRGKIWIEKEISDEKLSWLINSIKYNAFMDGSQKKEFIESLISLGSKTFQNNNNAKTMVDGGRIFHVEGSSLFKQLSEIDKAIALGKKIRFTYSKLKRNGSKFVYEAEKEYTVSPYWVIVNKGNTYLVCYNHEENKIWHSRVDKMRDVKMINSYALPKTETELKGVDVGDYVTKHPLMFSGDNISVELKIAKNQIGRLVEAFGTNFSIIKETEDYLTVKVYAGELDMFHWAIQYGGFVEILKPQSLRDKIRYHVESMTFKYKCGDGDRYSQEIKKARRGLHLELKGIDLSRRTEHFKLNKIYRVFLSDNNLTDITFLENYPELCEISLKNNNVSDLSILGTFKNLEAIELYNLGDVKNIDFIANLNKVKKLIIDFDRDVDLSKASNIKGLEYLAVSERCSYNLSLDIEKIKRENPKIKIVVFDREYNRSNKDLPKYMLEPFYKIMLKIAFGFFVEFGGDENEMSATVEEMVQKLPLEEKEIIELMYREKLSKYEISVKLNKSEEEVQRLRMSALSKISHESFNEKLKKFIIHK